MLKTIILERYTEQEQQIKLVKYFRTICKTFDSKFHASKLAKGVLLLVKFFASKEPEFDVVVDEVLNESPWQL